MHADSFFCQGKSHKVCQDYARHEGGIAALSDGCSGSPDTDFGARLLVMEMLDDPTSFWDAYRFAVDAAGCISGLPDTCLDATQLWLYGANNRVQANVVGDGTLAARHKSGQVAATRVRFKPGRDGQVAAGYAAYLHDSTRMDAYVKAGCNTRIVECYADGAMFTSGENIILDEEDFNFQRQFFAPDYDFVAIFSDGIESFEREVSPKKWEPVPFTEVLVEVMAIKNPTGEFVQRRCQKFFKQFCVEKRWRNQDDFSMAAVWCAP